MVWVLLALLGGACGSTSPTGSPASGGGSGGGIASGTGGGAAGTGGGFAGDPDAGTPSTMRVDNPYVGAIGYVNADWAALVANEAAGHAGAVHDAMLSVARQPTFVWLDRIGAIAGTSNARGLRAHLDAALAQQTASGKQVVVQLVVYDLPNRDCAALASNGELSITSGGLARYKTEFIDPIVQVLSSSEYATLRIVAVVEVDSLPNLLTNASLSKCQEAAGPGGYVEGITWALERLGTVANVYSYLDIAHSGWLGWDDNLGRAVAQYVALVEGTAKKWDGLAGFASNSANYTPTEELNLADPNLSVGGAPLRSASFYEWNPHFDELDYATAFRARVVAAGAPARLGVLIDTGRNGWGGSARPAAAVGSTPNDLVNSGRVDRRLHRGNWCNQRNAGIGARPTVAPHAGVHAFVWIKPPGESDGSSTPTTGANAEGKQHDPMCSPSFTGSQQANGGHLTGALANAPHAGAWFPEHFLTLVENAWPRL